MTQGGLNWHGLVHVQWIRLFGTKNSVSDPLKY